MDRYLAIARDGFVGYWDYLRSEILWAHAYKPWYENYFYWLIALSLGVWLLEIVVPWRKGQRVFRRDFWLDGFYMFFNFFLFSLIAYNALSNVGVQLFDDLLARFGVTNLVAVRIDSWPWAVQLLTMFVVADFIQWNVHRTLHAVPWLWRVHQVHHSVKEMGFAAHLRYHWGETIAYKGVLYVPLAMIGFGIDDFFVVHMVALAIGHLNHANLDLSYGPLGYLLNNPRMHIWHHAKDLPRPHGVNFGISLSLWDYLFGTAHVPSNGRDVELGWPDDDAFPRGFFGQMLYPFRR
jgi:sterol desaturase/sphingolipid hydroxylase (fatty acid hydroxylase superfamily)